MAKETKRLMELFAIKDEIEGFLANLDQLKSDDQIGEGQYTAMKGEYEQRLNSANSEILQIKNVLKKQLEAAKRDIDTYKFELGRIETKYKVGELPLDKYQSTDRKLRATMEAFETSATELDKLIEAQTSADISAPIKKPAVTASELPSLAKVAAPVREVKLPKTKLPKAKARALPSLTKVAPIEEGFLRPRTKIAVLVGGALLLISIFLPWIAASETLGKELGSESGMGVSVIIGTAGIVCGLAAMGSAFFPSPKARGIVQIVMGALALAMLPVIVFTGIMPLLSKYARTLVVIREGLYLYLIAAIILIIIGAMERKRG